MRRKDEKLDLMGIDIAAEALLDAAIKDRDMSALKEIGDRIDGKVPQGISGDEDGSPLSVIIQRVSE